MAGTLSSPSVGEESQGNFGFYRGRSPARCAAPFWGALEHARANGGYLRGRRGSQISRKKAD
eukprot:3047896-Pyramimonas_sp.AAC.1